MNGESPGVSGVSVAVGPDGSVAGAGVLLGAPKGVRLGGRGSGVHVKVAVGSGVSVRMGVGESVGVRVAVAGMRGVGVSAMVAVKVIVGCGVGLLVGAALDVALGIFSVLVAALAGSVSSGVGGVEAASKSACKPGGSISRPSLVWIGAIRLMSAR